MGYGHQRAAYPLKHLAYKNQIITANSYPGIPPSDHRLWHDSRIFYEFMSRFKRIPLIGKAAWDLYDNLQEIPKFYPRRDLSKLSMQVKNIYFLIETRQWGKHLIQKLSKNPIPMICSFFIPAFMAEVWGYPGEIYLIATDADINRAWAPKHPATSKIKYFAPNYRVAERLKLYGVRPENIFLTGFPLPIENTGDNLEIAKNDLVNRLVNLDPKLEHWKRYRALIKKYVNVGELPKKSNHPLTLMFAVGGAGAQREIGAQLLGSLRKEIREHKIRIVLVAGIHNSVSHFFRQAARGAGLERELDKYVKIIFANSKNEYFKRFNHALRTADILWTKPSELSFYSALGVPIIIAPPIGSQEEFNRKWLRTIGSAVTQDDPRYANQWLMDWVESGWFAEAAMEGFVEAPKYGTYNIERIIWHRLSETKKPDMLLQY
jgi:hypothetical protein